MDGHLGPDLNLAEHFLPEEPIAAPVLQAENVHALPVLDLNSVPQAFAINWELNDDENLSPLIKLADPAVAFVNASPDSGYSSPVDEEI